MPKSLPSPTRTLDENAGLTNPNRRRFLLSSYAVGFGLSTSLGLLSTLQSARGNVAQIYGSSRPYFFLGYTGAPVRWQTASYVRAGVTYRFPSEHRLAPFVIGSDMEPMERTLTRLFIRCDYDYERFVGELKHGIQALALPFASRHVGHRGAWLYPSGDFHGGLDFNNLALAPHPYSDVGEISSFDVLAAADGTVVGWDGRQLLTLEHVSDDGKLYRTFYNMMRNVPVVELGAVFEMGTRVRQGDVIGESYGPGTNRIHLHFGMNIRFVSDEGWQPDGTRLFEELNRQFGLVFDDDEQKLIARSAGLTDDLTKPTRPWGAVEWFPVDPYGVYGLSSGVHGINDYAPTYSGAYYPIAEGIGTYSFRDPEGERVPYRAASAQLRNNLSVQAISLGTSAALFE